MTQKEVGPGIDASTNKGQEQKITPFTFDDLGAELFYPQYGGKEKAEQRSLDGNLTTFLGTGFHYSFEEESQRYVPDVVLEFVPALYIGGRRFVPVLALPVNGSSQQGISLEVLKEKRHEEFDPNNHFEAYDFDVSRIFDPEYTEDIPEIRPGSVPAAHDKGEAAKLESWVSDDHLRNRINEWFHATVVDRMGPYPEERKKADQIKKYVQLRQAPFNTSNSPGFGRYTYEGVKEEATKEFDQERNINTGRMEDVPVRFRMFTREHLAWLETFMKNKGIQIPGKE
ncbi:MAG: hypothetical protein ACHQT7_00555 [Candidatus Levyibacteriota bacterium]